MTTPPIYNPTTMTIEQWTTHQQKTDTKHWIRISAETGDWLLPHTRRDDIITIVEPGSADGAPAHYLPETATIHIDPDHCQPGTNPADIHLDTPAGRYTHPAIAGAARHEAGHAAHTHWTIDQTPPMRTLMETALLLEEPAMEKDIITEDPDAHLLLRSSFHTIVNTGNNTPGTPAAAAHLACLAHGRADAGILTTEEIQPIIDHCTRILGTDRYQQLRQVWLDVQTLPTPRTDTTEMTRHAQRWLDILGPDTPTTNPTTTLIPICGTPGNTDPTTTTTITTITETTEHDTTTARDHHRNQEHATTHNQEHTTNRTDTTTATTIFTTPRSGGHGTEGPAGTRPPTPRERGDASRLATALQHAQYRDRATTTTPTTTPPGRLNHREALKRSAEHALGLPPTATPFQRRERRHIPQPPITIAIACDISGSMQRATRDAASAAWIIANAVHRTDGDTATVAYGNHVHPIIRPGQTPTHVQQFNATGGTENFTTAIHALTGALHLTTTTGARLLVIISDGHYTPTQRTQGQHLIDRLTHHGTPVLWIGFNGTRTHRYPSDTPMNNTTYIHITDTTTMGATIGTAMVNALTRA